MVNSVNKSPTIIQHDHKDWLWPLEQRITIMLCLSSGVTVATGLKSDRITDESTLSDTSATIGLVKLGMEDRLSICNQPDTHTHTRRCRIYPCHTYTRYLSNTNLALISCSNIQLWLKGLRIEGLSMCVCACVCVCVCVCMHFCICKSMEIYALVYFYQDMYSLGLSWSEVAAGHSWPSSRHRAAYYYRKSSSTVIVFPVSA